MIDTDLHIKETVRASRDLLLRAAELLEASGDDATAKKLRDTVNPPPPAESYYVCYRVTWQPEAVGDTDPPMDFVHRLAFDDTRIVTYEMTAIGPESEILHGLAESEERHGVVPDCDNPGPDCVEHQGRCD